MKIAFIVGSPRSGTTILQNILNAHRDIAEWYEPYYVWGRFFSAEQDDVWKRDDYSVAVGRKIRREYQRFSETAGKPIVVDKLPTHVFNIAIIRAIFPEAKWIHILRDGRDVVLSIRKEWMRRSRIVQKKDLRSFVSTAAVMLQLQPYLRYRLMAFAHELRSRKSPKALFQLNKSRWKGMAGWGPRFEGWEEFLRYHSTLEFNAMQWVKSVEAVQRVWGLLPEADRCEIRYEELLHRPEEVLGGGLHMLKAGEDPDFLSNMPAVRQGNTNKWQAGFTSEEIERIKPILHPMLTRLCYTDGSAW